MRFRTEIGMLSGGFKINHSDRIVLLGSCFADNIGEKLKTDGFSVIHNPLGPLFNPESVCRVISRGDAPYEKDNLICFEGVWHCLDFANRYQSEDSEKLLGKINDDYMPLAQAIIDADVIVVTLGTNKVYRHNGITAGNCHKLPAKLFEEKYLSVAESEEIGNLLTKPRTILTVSPVRYPGEGLAKGFLSKATLRVAVENICKKNGFDYFPAFEIVNDDLRDYRFYAADMRHPSEVAVDYIYEKFAEAYFTDETMRQALKNRKDNLKAAHRPIINDL